MRSTADSRSSFSVLITAERRIERNRAARVAGAAAARNDREAELDAALDEAADFFLGVRDTARRTDTRRASRWRRSRATRARGRRTRCCPCRCSARASAARACAYPRSRRTPPRSDRRPRRRPRSVARPSRDRAPRRSGASVRPVARRFSISRSRWRIASTSRRCRFGLSSRSSCRYGLRSTTQMSPSTSNSMRAERPVRRSPRSSSSSCHISAPSRRITISRSENDV